MKAARPRVAFVVARCGEELAGGAERLALETARRMQHVWDVELLTTCARDAQTWADAYEPGACEIAGVPARRFSVPVPRNRNRFDRRSRRVRAPDPGHAEQEAWMTSQGPIAPQLFAHLEQHGNAYARVVFYSYLYATTYFGLPPVAERSILVPLAHDEWMLELPLFDGTFSAASALAFVSAEERALNLRRRPSLARKRDAIVGAGIDPPEYDAQRFRSSNALHDTLLVCVGRVEEAKGTAELVDYFDTLQRVDPQPRTLALLGPVAMSLPQRPDIRAFGFVSEAEKWDALAAATFACVPSAFESLSLAALEAWATETAVLANGASAVLVGQCRRSNGGLWYATREEFVELARTGLFGRAAALGKSGARYVIDNYAWDDVCERLERLAFGAST